MAMGILTAELIDSQAERMCRSRHVHGAVLAVDHPAAQGPYVAAAGELAPGSQFCAASTTKLIVTIVTMRLAEAGRIALDEPMAAHLPVEIIAGLHWRKGIDHTGSITIRHLISNQTGLRDYFSTKGPDGRKPADTLMAGQDSPWPLKRTLQAVRGSEAQFLPGQKGKVAYSDTNYQLMGTILERVTGQSLPDLFAAEVFSPLGLRKTYIYCDPADERPVWFYAGARRLHLPRYLASVQFLFPYPVVHASPSVEPRDELCHRRGMLIVLVLWAAAQEYLILYSVPPGLSLWLGLATAAAGLVMTVSALCPARR